MLKKMKRSHTGTMYKFLKPQGKPYLVSFYMILKKNGIAVVAMATATSLGTSAPLNHTVLL